MPVPPPMPILDAVLVLAALGCWMLASLLSWRRNASDHGRTSEHGRTRDPGWTGGEGTCLALGLAGALVAIYASLHVLLTGQASAIAFPFFRLPARIEVDALSAAFLLPLHLVAGLGLVYGKEYWPARRPSGRSVRAFFALLAASLTLVFTARQGLLFLVGWEAMALSAFFLIGTDHEKPAVRRAAWVYLVCTHTGTLLLIAMTILLARRCGGFLWVPAGPVEAGLDGAILVLALAGFGFKAGLVPLHFWLPEAHAGAPSHASAILSSVLLKTGIYGMLRISTLVVVPPLFGEILLLLGALSALYGVLCALAQEDAKRLLAYSSIENIGIIAMGVGLGCLGRGAGIPLLAALGFGGAVFHVWNHALFKSLLFFGAGCVLHATGTRRIEALGGLARAMPSTALLIFPGVLAVSALPPFNAFLSEWFLYRGFLSCLQGGAFWSVSLALAALALTGGLAAVAFAKFYGFLFLGEPRTPAAQRAHDPGRAMLGPMVFQAALCLAVGLGGWALLPMLDRVVAVLAPEAAGHLTAVLAPDLRILGACLLLLVLLALACLGWIRSRRGAPRPSTWDCGYARPTARMQYTASSFSDGWASLLPGVRRRIRRIRGLFPRPVALHASFQDALGEGFLDPRVDRAARRMLRFRQLQQGQLSAYILYVLLTLLAVFLWMLARPRILG